MSIFGLSPLFLSLVASKVFTVPGQTLDIPRYFTWVAVMAGLIHVVTAMIFRANQAMMYGATEHAKPIDSDSEAVAHATEEEPLLRGECVDDSDGLSPDPIGVPIVPVQEPQEGSTLELFQDRYFWVLCLWMVLIVGAVCFSPSQQNVSSLT